MTRSEKTLTAALRATSDDENALALRCGLRRHGRWPTVTRDSGEYYAEHRGFSERGRWLGSTVAGALATIARL